MRILVVPIVLSIVCVAVGLWSLLGGITYHPAPFVASLMCLGLGLIIMTMQVGLYPGFWYGVRKVRDDATYHQIVQRGSVILIIAAVLNTYLLLITMKMGFTMHGFFPGEFPWEYYALVVIDHLAFVCAGHSRGVLHSRNPHFTSRV